MIQALVKSVSKRFHFQIDKETSYAISVPTRLADRFRYFGLKVNCGYGLRISMPSEGSG